MLRHPSSVCLGCRSRLQDLARFKCFARCSLHRSCCRRKYIHRHRCHDCPHPSHSYSNRCCCATRLLFIFVVAVVFNTLCLFIVRLDAVLIAPRPSHSYSHRCFTSPVFCLRSLSPLPLAHCPLLLFSSMHLASLRVIRRKANAVSP